MYPSKASSNTNFATSNIYVVSFNFNIVTTEGNNSKISKKKIVIVTELYCNFITKGRKTEVTFPIDYYKNLIIIL